MATDLRVPPVANSPAKVQLARLSYVAFEYGDLDAFADFAADFGFVEVHRAGDTVYYAGYGVDPYVYVATRSADGAARFKGPAFVARSAAEFDKAGALPGAVLSNLDDAPGGGKLVTFTRPDGISFSVVHGQRERAVDATEPTATHTAHGPLNRPFDKPRVGRFQRYRAGPALVHKLGHLGYICRDFGADVAWYTGYFNFVPSDVLFDPGAPDTDTIVFLHLDLGREYADHHCLFLARGPPGGAAYLHHTSFEVSDFDTQLLGHEWLAKKGWKSVWGVGRHILGSQIFDYWADPSGFKIEHYADGDLVNEDAQTNREASGPLSVWGPDLPKEFFRNEVPVPA